ncbi:MAG: YceD family protein [Ignavibacteriaceae bacterium]
MIIKISNLREGVHNYIFDEPIKEIGIEDFFFGNVLAEIELNKSNNQIVLNATLKLNANFECDRCNTNCTTNITMNYQMVYLFGKEPVESDSINVVYLPLDADKIKLDDDIKDFALLSIPMKKLCKDDCKGLCFKCGKNLNEGNCSCDKSEIDVRWLPLVELKNKINTN